MSNKLKLTTFIDKNIGIETRRKAAFKPALTLLSDLYSAYLYAPRAQCAYTELEGIEKYLHFDTGHCPEYAKVRGAFDQALRVELHVVCAYYDLAFIQVAFFNSKGGKSSFFEIRANLTRNGRFIRVKDYLKDKK